MPPKKTATGQSGAGKKKPEKRPKTLYERAEKIPEGTSLTDSNMTDWCIGKSIGQGGFGEIYEASKAGEKAFNYAVKCEPQRNGPLFCEMHFYMRNCKQEDIKKFQRSRGLHNIGVPIMLGHGLWDSINGKRHRFIVLPRYGNTLEKPLNENGGRLPEATIYRIAIQMLDAYEYIHCTGYIHADLKAANILLDYGSENVSQCYLLDYGLVSRYTIAGYKPDKNQMRNGTKEYLSRDAHNGVITMRSDLEILGYNLIKWLGAELPWKKLIRETAQNLDDKIQKTKEAFMSNVKENLKGLLNETVSLPLEQYLQYVLSIQHNEKPDYQKCRKIFEDGLKTLKVANAGNLVLSMTKGSKPTEDSPNGRSKGGSKRRALSPAVVEKSGDDSDAEEICTSDDDDKEVILVDNKKPPVRPMKTSNKVKSPVTRKAEKLKKPARRSVSSSPVKREKVAAPSTITSHTRSPRRIETTAIDVVDDDFEHTEVEVPTTSAAPTKNLTAKRAEEKQKKKPAMPIAARAMPLRKLSASGRGRSDSTIVNDNVTPNPKANKLYEFNFESDASMDANEAVNVKRKKVASSKDTTTSTPATSSSSASVGSRVSTLHKNDQTSESSGSRSPATRVNSQNKRC